MKFAYTTGARPLEGFTIQRGVGIGGFGEVYFAVSDAGKEVALKCIQRNLDVEVRGVTQCLNLKHSNLIDLYDLKHDDQGQAWVVMEFVAGQRLKDVIDRNPHGLPLAEAERWFRGMAAGVSYLHQRGLVHRDLKPGNVFDDDGVVKIGDYGLSKLIHSGRCSGQTESVGTFHYMAPEIGRGSYGRSVDIYALGIILYEMLTGCVPFDGESSQEIIMKHLTDDPDLSRLPEAYRAVVGRALHKDPEKRFADVADFLAALPAPGRDAPAAAGAMESGAGRAAPFYIGEARSAPEIVFGPMRHHEVVMAEAVPPAGTAARERFAPAPLRCGPSPAPRSSPVRPAASPRASGWDSTAIVLLAVAVALLLFTHPLLIPVAILAGGVYLLIAAIRSVASGRFFGLRPAWSDANRRLAARDRLRKKPVADRIGELAGSLLVSGLTAAALCAVGWLAVGGLGTGSVAAWAQYAWLTLVSVAGAWLLLVLGKCWEGREGGGLGRRAAMLVAGLVLGVVAWAAGRLFLVDFSGQPPAAAAWLNATAVGRWLYTPDGGPLPAAFLLFFVALFAPLRWWKQADPLRRSRLSITATALCVLWAWIGHMVVGFPQPWGLLMAAATAVSVQLAAPRINPQERALS